MMKARVIEKETVPALLKDLSAEHKVYAPLLKDAEARFGLAKGRNIFWNYQNTRVSPKEIFFPRTEILCSFQDFDIRDAPDLREKKLIFGMRPCDARAIAFLDKLFCQGKFRDPYYLGRREETVVVALACNEPQMTCFCTSVGGKPDGNEGLDIALYDLGKEVLLEPVSDRGKELTRDWGRYVKEAEKPHLLKKKRIINTSTKRMRPRIGVDGLKKKLEGCFENHFWDDLHWKCLGCGICAFLCPTCHCFDITDELLGDRGKRMRCWDSCMFPLFTLRAAGDNPRPTVKERIRQRIMHKFSYCPDNFGEVFCVGCGRCVRSCPVNLDIREIISSVLAIRRAGK